MKKRLSTFILSALILLSCTNGFALYIGNEISEPIYSETQLKYEELLSGNYRSVELKDKFAELFGSYSEQYILENCELLFGIEKAEIDEGLLEILTHGHTCENANQDEIIQLSNTNIGVEPMILPDPPAFPDRETIPVLVSTNPIAEIDSDITLYEVPILIDDMEENKELKISEDPDTNEDFEIITRAFPSSNSFVSISYISKTANSVTFDVWFKNNNDGNNILEMEDQHTGQWTYLLGRDGKPAGTTRRYTATGLKTAAVYLFRVKTYDWGSNSWQCADLRVETNGKRTPQFSVISKTSTSITFNAQFPSDNMWGNGIYYWDGSEWIDGTGKGNLATSGRYTIKNLVPGYQYIFDLCSYDALNGQWEDRIRIYDRPTVPAPTYQNYSRSDMEFQLDKVFTDLMGASRLNRYLDKTNNGYDHMYTLVGGAKPFDANKMGLHMDQATPPDAHSGNPIMWNWSAAVGSAYAMSRFNADTDETTFHEIGHNFDSWKWTFEAEALAELKVYYYYAMTGESVIVNYNNRITGGSGYLEFLKSGTLRGPQNYDASIPNGIYSQYGLAYNLGCIANQIGWGPFRTTFRYFDSLAYDSVPSTRIGKFNLFLAKLSDYSGQDVFAMLNAQEKAVYGAHFGGVIENPQFIPNTKSAETLTSAELTKNVLSTEAHNRILNYFGGTYPSYYGGTFINTDQNLVVMLTQNTAAIRDVLTRTANREIIFKTVDYSYAQLRETMDQIGDELSASGNAFALTMNSAENTITVQVDNIASSEIREFEAILGADALEIAPMGQTRFEDNVAQESTLREVSDETLETPAQTGLRTTTTLYLGDRVTVWRNGELIGNMSIGTRARRLVGGVIVDGFFTTAHYLVEGDTIYHGAVPIGVVDTLTDIYNPNGVATADAAFVRLTNSNYTIDNKFMNLMGQWKTVDLTTGEPTVGTVINLAASDAQGIYTPKSSAVRTVSYDDIFNTEDDSYVRDVILVQDDYSVGGNSGGLIYYGDTILITAGINRGSVPIDGVRYGCFSKIDNVVSELNAYNH
ncbi:hypothetical protein LJC32_03070 [Oscillospiraceae bacterium OttesenSCG-928-F05]|nr:hypothetical protein [Oscillospiraceae bacterium OttesenSCG-928-F05]